MSQYDIGDLVAESTTMKSGMITETNNETNEARVQFGDGTAQWVKQENLRAVLMEFGEEDSEDNKKTWIKD